MYGGLSCRNRSTATYVQGIMTTTMILKSCGLLSGWQDIIRSPLGRCIHATRPPFRHGQASIIDRSETASASWPTRGPVWVWSAMGGSLTVECPPPGPIVVAAVDGFLQCYKAKSCYCQVTSRLWRLTCKTKNTARITKTFIFESRKSIRIRNSEGL